MPLASSCDRSSGHPRWGRHAAARGLHLSRSPLIQIMVLAAWLSLGLEASRERDLIPVTGGSLTTVVLGECYPPANRELIRMRAILEWIVSHWNGVFVAVLIGLFVAVVFLPEKLPRWAIRNSTRDTR